MTAILTAEGLSTDDTGFAPLDSWDGQGGVDVPHSADAAAVLDRVQDAGVVRIVFPHFADGRGFTLARRLRQLGFAGRLRASGHVLPDQVRHAWRTGFDEVELADGAGDVHVRPVDGAGQGGYRERLGFR
ncbi:putative sulfite oxidoreductase (plasmid) [Rhodovulum sp. P5]|uniref:DUF934 domain-containing protein n=1 Tax=Rhodovulum sp. P5 TaxID=1564506 RepID=UPI0009C3D459|nr:DUF934 domain-containing protein [Rhodovulum sp. P5]ARE42298.1 putative sulfite oxidoreductase [Rhodovulum sp. P5]